MITITIGSKGSSGCFRAPMPYCGKCYQDSKRWFEKDPRFSRKYPMTKIGDHTFKCETCGGVQKYRPIKG
jgi:hypothetical protein